MGSSATQRSPILSSSKAYLKNYLFTTLVSLLVKLKFRADLLHSSFQLYYFIQLY